MLHSLWLCDSRQQHTQRTLTCSDGGEKHHQGRGAARCGHPLLHRKGPGSLGSLAVERVLKALIHLLGSLQQLLLNVGGEEV